VPLVSIFDLPSLGANIQLISLCTIFYIDIPLTHDTVSSELAPNFTRLEILLIETFSNQLVTDFRVPI